MDECIDLLIDLNASEEQLDCPFLFAPLRARASAPRAWMSPAPTSSPCSTRSSSTFPCPEGDPEGPLQLLVSTIDYNDYVGRIGIGRVERGTIKRGMMAIRSTYGSEEGGRAPRAHQHPSIPLRPEPRRVPERDGRRSWRSPACRHQHRRHHVPARLRRTPALCQGLRADGRDDLLGQRFSLCGQRGKFVTSRHLRARLMKELQTDVSLRVEDGATTDSFKVSGRGELHLTVLIETMRRQGYEFQVSKPEVLYKTIDGVKCEPMERLVVDVPEEYAGAVIEKRSAAAKGVMENMSGRGRVRLDFVVPSRGLFGYRSEFMTDTRGEGIMSTVFEGYEPYKGRHPDPQLRLPDRV